MIKHAVMGRLPMTALLSSLSVLASASLIGAMAWSAMLGPSRPQTWDILGLALLIPASLLYLLLAWQLGSLLAAAIEAGDPPKARARLRFPRRRRALVSDRKAGEGARQIEAGRSTGDPRLALASRSAHIGFWDLDMSCGLLQWDEEMHRLHGLRKDTFGGSLDAWSALIVSEDRTALVHAVAAALRGGRTLDVEFRVCGPDGAHRFIKANAVSMLDAGGAPSRMVGVCHDVSDLRNADLTLVEQSEAILQKNELLLAASRMKSDFLSSMSHELRTPLNVILGFSDILRADGNGALDAQQRQHAQDIHSSGERLLVLVDDMLEYCKLCAGQRPLVPARVELRGLVEDVVAAFRQQRHTSRIDVELDVPASLQPVEADVGVVRQVLSKLLSNAAKFSPEGRKLALSVRQVPRTAAGRLTGGRPGRVLPLRVGPQAEYVEMRVIDHGLGISERGLDKLFDPFSQIDGGRARGFEGAGLGLVMVRKLVELHGGTVAVESAEGEGSVFTVWLPAHYPHGEACSARPGREAPGPAGPGACRPASAQPAKGQQP